MSNPEDESKPPLPKDDWKVDSPNIMHLTDNTFKSEIKSKEPILVMFYAPCKYYCTNNSNDT